MTPCRACDRPFPTVTRGGNEKQFCSADCKNAYHTACRRYADEMIDRGLTSREIVMAFSPSCTTAGQALDASEVVGGAECSK